MSPDRPTEAVLFVSSSEDVGGGEFVLFDAIDALRWRELPCSVLNLVATPGDLSATLRARGIETNHCRIGRFRDPGSVLRVLGRFVARRHSFSLAIANDARAFLYTAVACRLLRRPCLWYVHDLVTGATPFERVGARLGAARAIAVSDAVRKGLESLGWRASRISVVHNAVDVNRFHPDVDGSGVRREWGISPTALVVGAVGRILPLKALETLIQAAAMLKPTLPDAVYVIVGDVITDRAHQEGALRYRDDLRALRDRLGLERQVLFVGGRKDLPEVMAALDLLVHPSTTESFGRVLVEAMAAGKPVVASAVGGVPEIVREGVTGYLVRPLDPPAVADRIRMLLDPAVRDRLGRAGRALAETAFSPGAYETGILRAVLQARPELRPREKSS